MSNHFSKDYFHTKGKNAEKIVHDLTLTSFLTDWCYLNPRWPDGKELCDLLVVFDDTAIIWQVKDLKLDENGHYNKAEVEKNLKQLAGARRHLFELKKPLELENPRRGTEAFDPSSIKDIFLISVLMGESEQFFSFVEELKNHTIHVFTRAFTQIALGELDTIADFCAYLKSKEQFLSQKKHILILGGEEELLASYLLNDRSFGWLKEPNTVMIAGGTWQEFISRVEYKEKKDADKIGYGWDSIIDRLHESGDALYERVARELARHTRFERRFLAKSFFDAHVVAHEGTKPIFRRLLASDEITYGFLFVDKNKSRDMRRKILEIFCFVARGMHAKGPKVIGIATEKQIEAEDSYDVLLLNVSEWTAEHQRRMEEMQARTGTLVDPKMMEFHEDEYPQSKEKN